MTNLSNAQISILHYRNNGIRSAHFIHRETKIPLSTVKYNIKKLRETKSLKHRGGNDRPCVRTVQLLLNIFVEIMKQH